MFVKQLMKVTMYCFVQVIDILLGYIDIGVMMHKPSSGKEKELKQHYKVLLLNLGI